MDDRHTKALIEAAAKSIRGGRQTNAFVRRVLASLPAEARPMVEQALAARPRFSLTTIRQASAVLYWLEHRHEYKIQDDGLEAVGKLYGMTGEQLHAVAVRRVRADVNALLDQWAGSSTY
jgi:hypothetical protein